MPIKILIYFAVYRRLELLEICLKGIERLQHYMTDRFEIDTFAVCSNKDESTVLSNHGIKHIVYPNEPLGAKKNAGLRKALLFDWDYLMELGSDDLLMNDILDIYEPHFDAGKLAFGVNTCWFYDVLTGKTGRFLNEYAIGAGRCFKRSMFAELDRLVTVRYLQSFAGHINGRSNHTALLPVNFAQKLVKAGLAEIISENEKPLQLWTNEAQRSLDGDSMLRLMTLNIPIEMIPVSLEKPYVLDIKSGTNINKFSQGVEIHSNALEFIPTNEANAIRRLRSENHVAIPVK